MELSPRQQLELGLRIAQKWRWYAIVPTVAVALCGALYAAIAPPEFDATATLSMDTDSPTNPLLRDLNVDQGRSSPAAVVTETIRSFDIMEKTVLDIGAGAVAADSRQFLSYLRRKLKDRLVQDQDVTVETAVSQLSRSVDVQQWGRDMVRVTYTGLDGEMAARITNTLVQRFVEYSSLVRQRGAQATVDFIFEQLAVYRRRLEDSEARVAAFREANRGALPNQFEGQLGALAQARSDLMAADISMRETEERLKLLRGQLKQTSANIVSQRTTGANPVVSEMERRLISARVELAALRTNYTDKHPRVLELLAHIANLEKAIAAEEQTTVTSETSAMNPAYESLRTSIREGEIQRGTLQLRRDALLSRIAQLEEDVRNIPQQEQELIQLQRDNQVNASVYNLLLRKLEEAKISQQLAAREQDQEHFTIIEAARPSDNPTGPKRVQLVLFALAAGIAAGGAGVLGRHLMDESYDDVDQLTAAFDLPCLAVVPRIDRAV